MKGSLCQNSAPFLPQQPKRGRQRTRTGPKAQPKTSSRGLEEDLSRKHVTVRVQGATHGQCKIGVQFFLLIVFWVLVNRDMKELAKKKDDKNILHKK